MSEESPDPLDDLIREDRRADSLDSLRTLGRTAFFIAVIAGAWWAKWYFWPPGVIVPGTGVYKLHR